VKLSVVIPAWNEEQLLPACLESVFANLGDDGIGLDVELIVVDNNSTDRTAAVAEAGGARVVFEPVNQIAFRIALPLRVVAVVFWMHGIAFDGQDSCAVPGEQPGNLPSNAAIPYDSNGTLAQLLRAELFPAGRRPFALLLQVEEGRKMVP